jgi:hypothetical protein
MGACVVNKKEVNMDIAEINREYSHRVREQIRETGGKTTYGEYRAIPEEVEKVETGQFRGFQGCPKDLGCQLLVADVDQIRGLAEVWVVVTFPHWVDGDSLLLPEGMGWLPTAVCFGMEATVREEDLGLCQGGFTEETMEYIRAAHDFWAAGKKAGVRYVFGKSCVDEEEYSYKAQERVIEALENLQAELIWDIYEGDTLGEGMGEEEDGWAVVEG